MRVLLADDQVNVRSALRLLLAQEPDLDVVGEATGTEELLAQAKIVHPDLVLLDWELPGLQPTDPATDSGQQLLLTLHACHPGLRVIALSGRPEACQAALAAGADAFVSKGDPPERLLAAVDSCRQCNQAQ